MVRGGRQIKMFLQFGGAVELRRWRCEARAFGAGHRSFEIGLQSVGVGLRVFGRV